LGNNIFGVKRD